MVGLLAPGAADAASGVQEVVRTDDAAARTCAAGTAAGASGTVTRSMTAQAAGLLRARLQAAGDWDVAVFDAEDGRLVAASAGAGGTELAAGKVERGQRLVVQACRLPGSGATASVSTTVEALPTAAGEPVSVVEVHTPTRADKRRLQALGLDLTEHGTASSVEVVLHGRADAEKLRRAGLRAEVQIPDLAERDRANRAADAAYSARADRSPLPSGRTTYRRLADFEAEMKQLAQRRPYLVRLLTLPHRTVEGRSVFGIEITTNARRVDDGKPVFLNMGVHHAREWPSAEHAMEWAYELLNGYGRDAELTRIVRQTRTIVVPVVNPDGFTISREAGEAGDEPEFGLTAYEYKRKNCRISATTEPEYRTGTCVDNPAGGCAARTRTATTAASGAARARARCGPPTSSAATGPSRSRRCRTSASW